METQPGTDHQLDHDYVSTACLHGLCPEGTDDQSRWTCLQQCKYCETPNRCQCRCHGERQPHLPMSATSRAVADIRSARLAHLRDGHPPRAAYLTYMLGNFDRFLTCVQSDFDQIGEEWGVGQREYLVQAAAVVVAKIEEIDAAASTPPAPATGPAAPAPPASA
jgi:hypothetical protein